VCTFVRDGRLAIAGLRGSRVAELVDELALDQSARPEVARLLVSR
jgi:hypothetical protein